ncbi:hypothetical protein BJX68DRAFT_143676 [Aspergillus pseudodeflectus]|uniref:Uncharacterized protein n=1 Tax=Aspergillus pseudodeflectus TaxID=176178 RepID=A0ABR4L303_9EURO
MWRYLRVRIVPESPRSSMQARLETSMDKSNPDVLVRPSIGDVRCSNAETNKTPAIHAWRNSIFFSHGNYAIREPENSVYRLSTAPWERLLILYTPVDPTFAWKAYDKMLSLVTGMTRASQGRLL